MSVASSRRRSTRYKRSGNKSYSCSTSLLRRSLDYSGLRKLGGNWGPASRRNNDGGGAGRAQGGERLSLLPKAIRARPLGNTPLLQRGARPNGAPSAHRAALARFQRLYLGPMGTVRYVSQV